MSSGRWIWIFLIVFAIFGEISTSDDDNDVIVITVASNKTDGYERYLRSARVYGFEEKVITLGLGKPWKGGNMKSVGGGYKINLLKRELKKYNDNTGKIVIFTDSYDIIFLANLEEIIRKFKLFDARILFGAEKNCWPDKDLANQYPSVYNGDPYLNSGGIIGYAADLYAVCDSQNIQDTDDDQRFYTQIYLNTELRNKYKIKLDHKSDIFQNLHGSVADIELRFKDNEAFLQNTAYNTVPAIAHGNGLGKTILKSLGNYLAKAWSPDEGCLSCWDKTIELTKDEIETYPPILVAVFIDRPTPFLEEFLTKIYRLAYPKSKLYVFLYNNQVYHDILVNEWLSNHGEEYKSLKVIRPEDSIDVPTSRQLALNYCLLKECSGYFSIDSVAHLDNEFTLKLLVEQQRGIVAPLLIRTGHTWSNFWGAVADNGYYARSSDYMEIIQNKRRGLWNVPYINNCYLINVTIIENLDTRPVYAIEDLDSDMAFALTNRQREIFMFVSNRLDFGHLVNPDNFNIQYKNPDVYEIFNNKHDWEKRYIHENYSKNLDPEFPPHQPCVDVYWFPIVSERFTNEFIEIMEKFGRWSDGSNKDDRLQGGYENVPTRDIHMNQIDFEPHWLYFLKEYVRPLQELVFIGYFHDDSRLEGGYEAVPTRDIHMTQVGLHKSWLEFLRRYVSPLQKRVFIGYEDYPPRSLMNFVVRYRPDEQPSLRPHHDSSTYTINIALNRVGVDYEGGGCRFLRYNCSVTDTKQGWMLMHPGRLTHYHEGLQVTKGTRYIMISFVDP